MASLELPAHIKLHDIQGIARHLGTDEEGCTWIQFEVDYFAEQEAGDCSICGKMLEEGWMCLDGGEEVCDSHVEWTVPEEEN